MANRSCKVIICREVALDIGKEIKQSSVVGALSRSSVERIVEAAIGDSFYHREDMHSVPFWKHGGPVTIDLAKIRRMGQRRPRL